MGADPAQFGLPSEDVTTGVANRTFFRVYRNVNGRDSKLYMDTYTITGNVGDISNWHKENTTNLMMGFLGAGNSPMVGMTPTVAVAAPESLKK